MVINCGYLQSQSQLRTKYKFILPDFSYWNILFHFNRLNCNVFNHVLNYPSCSILVMVLLYEYVS